MPIAEANGVKLWFEDSGAGQPPVVLIHGWTCDHTFFAPQFDHFSAHHRVVAVDLRGHGASEDPETGYDIASLADDVAAVCRTLGLERAVAAGHSMGGLVAVQLASTHPGLISKLVVVDCAPIGPPAENRALLGQLLEGLAGPDPAGVRREFAEQFLFLETDDPLLKARLVAQMSKTPDHVARQCFEGIAAWDGPAALSSVAVEVLAIHADRPINDPDKLLALCPSVQNVRTEGVGHFNQLLAPGEVNRLIEDFIRA